MSADLTKLTLKDALDGLSRKAFSSREITEAFLGAIEAAEAGDVSVLERLLTVLREPYREQQGCDDLAARRPEWARDRPGCSALSCSS